MIAPAEGNEGVDQPPAVAAVVIAQPQEAVISIDCLLLEAKKLATGITTAAYIQDQH